LLDDAFNLIESLRAELFKSRAEKQKALGEKEKAESECIHARLKLKQMQVHLDNAQEALHAAQDRRAREVLSRSPGKNGMDTGWLKARKTPLHRTGLTRSPSRVVNRAPEAHALRSAGRGIEATDSGALHRSTAMRRQDKTLPSLNEFVSRAGPVHLPSVACPPESDTKAHNDYKANVCARARSRPHAVGAQLILASADSSLKAGMLRTLNARIDRIVHYSSVCGDPARASHGRDDLRLGGVP
jgi:hypothetical protein